VHGRQTRAAQSAKTRPALHHEFRPATGDGRAIIDRPDLGTIPCPSIPRTPPHGASAVGDLISLSQDWPLAGGRRPRPCPHTGLSIVSAAAPMLQRPLPAPGRVDCFTTAWPGQEGRRPWRGATWPFTHGRTLSASCGCSCSLQQGDWHHSGGEGRAVFSLCYYRSNINFDR